MRFRWPDDTVFHRIVLDVEHDSCAYCGRPLHICDHRIHRIYTLQHPLELCCRLAHCSDPACPGRPRTLSPAAELTLTLPGWLIGWDVFCFIGHRRFARHWSIPQIRDELLDNYRIKLSPDAIGVYIRRYQAMVAARQQDFALLQRAYRDIDSVVLSIDGLQPEKGHEALYAVRELTAGRVWFAEALLCSSTDEVRRLLVRAREFAHRLGKPVRLWISDKQDAFVKGIASEFRGVPHRYCANHFLRDLAKPTLAADSHAKVRMRKKVRGLRAIEREVLRRCRQAEPTSSPGVKPAAGEADGGAAPADGRRRGGAGASAVGRATPEAGRATAREATAAAADPAGGVVLSYCAAVRGILNDDQGGPLHPPGLRMAEALAEVRASLGRNLKLNRPGPAHGQLGRLAGCIDRGLAEAKSQQERVREQVKEIGAVATTLDARTGALRERRASYERLRRRYQSQGGEFYEHLARMLRAWSKGLFVRVRGKRGQEFPEDNLDLERWFRAPKGHERRIHGHRHAGVRIVHEGATLLLVLNAHEVHPQPFTAQELLPYREAEEPPDQREAIRRRKIMRAARSPKNGNPSWQT
ncbi:MAG: hypothetical protein JOY71_17690 [Acetobacteraceae bacterium]|nr:hypothetical protein [Acetobacteraceae bacterium]